MKEILGKRWGCSPDRDSVAARSAATVGSEPPPPDRAPDRLHLGRAGLAGRWPRQPHEDHRHGFGEGQGAEDHRRLDRRAQLEATCLNVGEGKETVFNGSLFLVNEETGERIEVGGVVSRPAPTTSGSRETYVAAIARPQRLRPELKIGCYESFPKTEGQTPPSPEPP